MGRRGETKTTDVDNTSTSAIDSIANDLLRDDIRSFCETLCAGTDIKGDQAFDDLFQTVAQFLEQCSYDFPTVVDIEKVPYNCQEAPTSCEVEEGGDALCDILLKEVQNVECDVGLGDDVSSVTNSNHGSIKRPRRPTKPTKGSRKKRLDDETLDALAHLLAKIPDDGDPILQSRRRSMLRRVGSSTAATRGRVNSEADRSMEQVSTRPLPRGRSPPNTSTDDSVFEFDNMARKMNKKKSTKATQARKSMREGVPEVRTARTRSMDDDMDWEHLDDFSLGPDPVFVTTKKKKSMWGVVANKLLVGRKKQVGYHRFRAPKKGKITFDDDGSVQVELLNG
ncbi:expressed unknown protein [Seminavis robusta]|uniref:Uncharacterized protein n=1 Tax=Seminavis robusta TaxID=568900 RepID=A0A9N8DG26_9STRA|nr:expressed unknown protein [Seminavis robusta]|eukprot:Sro75_g041260.1 n/a (338) ;mRNA; r:68855-69868